MKPIENINILELNKYINFISEFQCKNKYSSDSIKEYNAKFAEENNEFVKTNFTNIEDVNFYTVIQ
jgi:hypothetical protein